MFPNFQFVLFFLSIFKNFGQTIGCESSATFTIYKNSSSTIKWDTGTSLSSYGCSVNDKFSIVTHGWGDTQAWVSSTIEKILKHRGGCVIFLNYSSCVNNNNYAATLAHWKSLSAMVTVKLNTMEKEGIIPDNIFMYGFSLGARIVIDAAINFGKQKIGMIDVCEPANVGFDGIYKKNIKDAAKNVQCIFTSIYAGSKIRDQCHQNWLMGNCGINQQAVNDIKYFWWSIGMSKSSKCPLGSHSICNWFYESAFENDFVANNVNQCANVNAPNTILPNFKMGYKESRKDVRGVFAASTSMHYPYNNVS